jgi:hypothetical protein
VYFAYPFGLISLDQLRRVFDHQHVFGVLLLSRLREVAGLRKHRLLSMTITLL